MKQNEAPLHLGTLTDFLLARIAEDEVAIRKSRVHGWPTFEPFTTGRLLAECESKRRIVELELDRWGSHVGMSDTLQLLALPYVDHPDHRQEWRP